MKDWLRELFAEIAYRRGWKRGVQRTLEVLGAIAAGIGGFLHGLSEFGWP